MESIFLIIKKFILKTKSSQSFFSSSQSIWIEISQLDLQIFSIKQNKFTRKKYQKITMMNKQQNQITHLSIFGQSGINRKPQCPSQNQATFICLNPNCQVLSFKPTKNKMQQKEIPLENQLSQEVKSQNIRKATPFICSISDCQSCYPIQQNGSSFWGQSKNIKKNSISHAKCFKGDFQSLLVCIEQKKKESLPLKSCITQIFDNFIDYLSELRDKYLNQLNYYGLSQAEKSYLSCMQDGRYDGITSKMCFNVVKDLDHQAQVNSQMAKQKLKEYWQIEEKKIRKSIEFIEKIVNKEFTSTGLSTQIDSKIITELRQKQILIQMLEGQTQQKNVQSFNLLYRASENQFTTQAFHNKCDNINNTVLVMQTEFVKKIGGYTPLKWDKALNNRTEKDPSNNTFIFSLTNNHKFNLKQGSEAAILQYSSAGPTFGTGPSDIYVKSKANSTSMYGNIGNSFVHPDYTFGDQKSWTKFSGATDGKQFKAKEWQIFQVKWWQKD